MKIILTGLILMSMVVVMTTFAIAFHDEDKWSVRGNIDEDNIDFLGKFDNEDIDWAKGQFSTYSNFGKWNDDQTQGALSVQGKTTKMCPEGKSHKYNRKYKCHCDDDGCHKHDNFRLSVNWNWKGFYEITSVENDPDKAVIDAYARVIWNRYEKYWVPVTITIDKIDGTVSVESTKFSFSNIHVRDHYTGTWADL